jgi:hypothetical protein
MATMTGSDTDKRLDDLRSETHRGFDRVENDCREIRAEVKTGFDGVDAEFNAVRAEMKDGFDRADAEFRAVRAEVKAGFDSVHKMMIRFFAGTLGSIVAGVILLLVTHR